MTDIPNPVTAVIPTKKKVSDAIVRALRTFFQAFVASLILSGGLSAADVSGAVSWSVLEKIALSAAFAGVAALLAYVQNLLEDSGIVSNTLK